MEINEVFFSFFLKMKINEVAVDSLLYIFTPIKGKDVFGLVFFFFFFSRKTSAVIIIAIILILTLSSLQLFLTLKKGWKGKIMSDT